MVDGTSIGNGATIVISQKGDNLTSLTFVPNNDKS